MRKTGSADLPLHGGKTPRWLFARMKALARAVAVHVVEGYGQGELLRRLSDPFWFQAFGCVLGFDWHSSGVTTTACGALKEGLKGAGKELGVFVCGGKGRVARRTPEEIERACDIVGLEPEGLVRASRLSAKVDSAAVQDGFQIYHHVLVFTSGGGWAVVQQGMNDSARKARRYHWLGEGVKSFVEEPHAAVCSDARFPTLNFVAQESAGARGASVELVREQPDEWLAEAASKVPSLELPGRHDVRADVDLSSKRLKTALLRTYESAPKDFEGLLGVRGVGPKALRALSLAAEIIHGEPTSFRDPARFSFAHGGKDGHPYPVDRSVYDRTVEMLGSTLSRARVSHTERTKALKRLASWADDR